MIAAPRSFDGPSHTNPNLGKTLHFFRTRLMQKSASRDRRPGGRFSAQLFHCGSHRWGATAPEDEWWNRSQTPHVLDAVEEL